MGFTRSSLLTKEQKAELKKKMEPLWYSATTSKHGKDTPTYTAQTIAEQLHFGEEKIKDSITNKTIDNPYKNLKTHSVYLYSHEFKFAKRDGGIPKGRSRYLHKQTEIMTPEEFKKRLNTNCPKITDPTAPNYTYSCRKRAYSLLTYWSPLRKSEIIERLRKDFSIEGEQLIINLWRKKKYHPQLLLDRAQKDSSIEKEPFFLYLGTDEEMKDRMLDELVGWIKTKEKDEKVFDFSGTMARNYIIDVFGTNFYPHFGRANFISKAVEYSDNPGQLIPELLDDTYMDVQTIVKYIMKSRKNRSSITRRELNKMKEHGLVES